MAKLEKKLISAEVCLFQICYPNERNQQFPWKLSVRYQLGYGLRIIRPWSTSRCQRHTTCQTNSCVDWSTKKMKLYIHRGWVTSTPKPNIVVISTRPTQRPFTPRAVFYKHRKAMSSEILLVYAPIDSASLMQRPKNRIFTLLGLPTIDADPDRGDLFIEPKFETKIRSLYLQVAKKIMKQAQTLDVLSAVQHKSISRYRPTWVPRWISCSYTLAPLGSTAKSYVASKGFPDPFIEWTRAR